jgi:hypothetical protein
VFAAWTSLHVRRATPVAFIAPLCGPGVLGSSEASPDRRGGGNLDPRGTTVRAVVDSNVIAYFLLGTEGFRELQRLVGQRTAPHLSRRELNRRYSSTDASISDLRMETLSTLIPIGKRLSRA